MITIFEDVEQTIFLYIVSDGIPVKEGRFAEDKRNGILKSILSERL